MPIGQRIRKRREELRLSQDDLAKKLGYKSRSSINKIELDINDITQSKVIEFAKALQTTPAYLMGWEMANNDDWDLEVEKLNEHFNQSYNFRALVNTTGWSIQGYSNEEGIDEYKLRKDSIEITVSADEYLELMNTSKNFLNKNLQDLVKMKLDPTYKPEPYKEFMVIQPPILVPYYGHIASAGTGQYVFDDIPPELIELEYEMDNMEIDFAIGVNGDSMEPTYSDGDTLLVKKTEVHKGDIGIFMINGEAFVKELGDGKLVSHNKSYSDIDITSDTKCIGKVIGIR